MVSAQLVGDAKLQELQNQTNGLILTTAWSYNMVLIEFDPMKKAQMLYGYAILKVKIKAKSH